MKHRKEIKCKKREKHRKEIKCKIKETEKGNI